jgi:hypothetical protein
MKSKVGFLKGARKLLNHEIEFTEKKKNQGTSN